MNVIACGSNIRYLRSQKSCSEILTHTENKHTTQLENKLNNNYKTQQPITSEHWFHFDTSHSTTFGWKTQDVGSQASLLTILEPSGPNISKRLFLYLKYWILDPQALYELYVSTAHVVQLSICFSWVGFGFIMRVLGFV